MLEPLDYSLGALPLFGARPRIEAPPYQHGVETSRAAAQAIIRPATRLRAEVLRFIENEGERGATDEQITEGLGMNASTVRPRRGELVEGGLVRDSGRTRPGRSGRAMTVWVAAAGAGNVDEG